MKGGSTQVEFHRRLLYSFVSFTIMTIKLCQPLKGNQRLLLVSSVIRLTYYIA
jgi:hypothetical protein